MSSHRRLIALLTFSLAAVIVASAQTPVTLKSPDGALELSIATVGGQPAVVQGSGGQLAYRVTFRGKPVVDWSNLGLAIQGSPVLGSAVRVESSKTSANDTTWKSVAGKADPIRDDYNAATVETVETAAAATAARHRGRADDDGIAFRYAIPEQPGLKELRISDARSRSSGSTKTRPRGHSSCATSRPAMRTIITS